LAQAIFEPNPFPYKYPKILNPRKEAAADHQEAHSESRGKPAAEVGDPPAQRVEKGQVERYTRIPRF